MTIVFVILLWLGFAVFVGHLADKRGRNGAGWFFLSLLVSPLLAGICLMVLPESGTRKCPHCAEQVKPDAAVCKHCGRDIPRPAAAPVQAPNVARAKQKQEEELRGLVAIASMIGVVLLLFVVLVALNYVFG